jgi:CRP/FNR family cyclic AMP-dependent transcriptional regulator
MARTARRPLKHSLVRALRRVPDFSALDDRLLLKVVGASANLVWPAGAVIFEKESPSEALYIVLSGWVGIKADSPGDEDLAQIGPEDYFGELSLLRKSKHTKSAVAIDDCELMVLPKSSFEALMEADADLADQVRSKGAGRVGEMQLS